MDEGAEHFAVKSTKELLPPKSKISKNRIAHMSSIVITETFIIKATKVHVVFLVQMAVFFTIL